MRMVSGQRGATFARISECIPVGAVCVAKPNKHRQQREGERCRVLVQPAIRRAIWFNVHLSAHGACRSRAAQRKLAISGPKERAAAVTSHVSRLSNLLRSRVCFQRGGCCERATCAALSGVHLTKRAVRAKYKLGGARSSCEIWRQMAARAVVQRVVTSVATRGGRMIRGRTAWRLAPKRRRHRAL